MKTSILKVALIAGITSFGLMALKKHLRTRKRK